MRRPDPPRARGARGGRCLFGELHRVVQGQQGHRLPQANTSSPLRCGGQHHERRILVALDTPPPAGYARWNGTLLAKHLGDISKHQIWRVLREHEISLERRRSWCISTDPAFAQKAADIVALYLQPPENAVVLSVDEKPHIQALERAQGWLKLPNGKALTGFDHEYKRHGTTTLFAALEVATGLVKAGHYRRRRRVEFLHFMNRVLAAPQKSPFSLHPNPRLLAEPGGSLVFSILSSHALAGTSFTSPRQVRE